MKLLKEQAITVRSALLDGIQQTKSKAKSLMEQPNSEDALQAFQSSLESLHQSISNTKEQMDSIQALISSLPAEAENTEGPIGMAPTQ